MYYLGEVAADRLAGSIAESPFRRRVEIRDVAVFVAADDAIERGVQDRSLPLVAGESCRALPSSGRVRAAGVVPCHHFIGPMPDMIA